jgi:hypothetical protein
VGLSGFVSVGDRRKEIMRVLASVQSIAIDVSRAPTFRRRFREVMGAVMAKALHEKEPAEAVPPLRAPPPLPPLPLRVTDRGM